MPRAVSLQKVMKVWGGGAGEARGFFKTVPSRSLFQSCGVVLLGEQKEGGDHEQVKTCENRELEKGEESLGATKVSEGVEQRALGCPEGV